MRLVLTTREQSYLWWDWTVLFYSSRKLSEFPRDVKQFSFYCCTVVLLYRISATVALYYSITSLPVYPSTIHGHCIVVLDTSN